MSPTHDYVIANGTGSSVRSDINDALAAVVSQNSSSTAPATTYAYMIWVDTTTNIVKMRNGANSAWIELFETDGEFGSKTFNGNITLNAQGDLRFADSDSSNWVAFQAPATVASNVTWTLPSADGTANQTLVTNGSGTLSWATPTSTSDKITEGNTEAEVVDTGSDGHFKVTTEGTERFRINSSGNVGIGTTSVTGKLSIDGSALNPISSLNTASNYAIALYGGSSTGAGNGIAFCNDNGTSVGGAIVHIDQGSNNLGDLAFYTAATANSPSEKARLTASGQWLVGTSSTRTLSGVNAQIQLEGTSENTASQSFIINENSSGGVNVTLGKTRGTSIGGTTVVNNGDDIGTIRFSGSDGSSLLAAALIRGAVDGTPGTNDMPGRLVFSTTADGASSPTERMRIANNGRLSVGSNISDNGHWMTNPGTDTSVLRLRQTQNAAGVLGLYYDGQPNNANDRFLSCLDNNGGTARCHIQSNGGIANYQANDSNLSDARAKKDIEPAANTWDCIKQWEIVNYRYKDQSDDADLNLGVIAQQVAESCPEVITVFQEAKEATETEPAQEERLGVKEQQMYWMAIKALQEAQVRIEQLEATNADLLARVSALETA